MEDDSRTTQDSTTEAQPPVLRFRQRRAASPSFDMGAEIGLYKDDVLAAHYRRGKNGIYHVGEHLNGDVKLSRTIEVVGVKKAREVCHLLALGTYAVESEAPQ